MALEQKQTEHHIEKSSIWSCFLTFYRLEIIVNQIWSQSIWNGQNENESFEVPSGNQNFVSFEGAVSHGTSWNRLGNVRHYLKSSEFKVLEGRGGERRWREGVRSHSGL